MTEDILALLAGLAGLGGFISILVNVLKSIGVVKDGTSETWVRALNLLSFVAVAVVYFMKVQVEWSLVNGFLVLGSTLLGMILQLFTSTLTYAQVKGIPVIGFSYSEQEVG